MSDFCSEPSPDQHVSLPYNADWVQHLGWDIHPIVNTFWIQLLSQLQIHKTTALIQPTFHHLSHKETMRGTVNPKLKPRPALFMAYTWFANIVTLSKEEMRLVWNNLCSVKSFCFQLTTAFLPKCSPTICFLILPAFLLSRIYLKLNLSAVSSSNLLPSPLLWKSESSLRGSWFWHHLLASTMTYKLLTVSFNPAGKLLSTPRDVSHWVRHLDPFESASYPFLI